jgi:hypothetical protein
MLLGTIAAPSFGVAGVRLLNGVEWLASYVVLPRSRDLLLDAKDLGAEPNDRAAITNSK